MGCYSDKQLAVSLRRFSCFLPSPLPTSTPSAPGNNGIVACLPSEAYCRPIPHCSVAKTPLHVQPFVVSSDRDGQIDTVGKRECSCHKIVVFRYKISDAFHRALHACMCVSVFVQGRTLLQSVQAFLTVRQDQARIAVTGAYCRFVTAALSSQRQELARMVRRSQLLCFTT